MAQDIIVRYRAEVDDLTNKLKVVADRMDKLEENSKLAGKAIGALDKEVEELGKDLGKVEKEAGKAGTKLKSTAKDAADALKPLKTLGTQIAAGFVAAFSIRAIENFAQASIKAFSQLESARLVFKNLVGDAREAEKLFARLEEFSIKTPFTPEQVQSAAKALLQFGVAVDDVLPTVKTLGDVSAGTGKDLTELAIIFGQIRSAGRLTGQDLLQLINAGFNPLQEISERTGKNVATLRKEMEKGKITFQDVAESFKAATSEGGKFFNLTEQLATTTAGKLSTLEGEAVKLQQTIGEKLAPTFVALKVAALDFVNTTIDGFKDLIFGAKRYQAQLELDARARLQERIEAQLQGENEINQLGILANAQKEFLETGIELRKNQAAIVKAELKDDQASVRTLEAKRKELSQTAGILKEIIESEKKRTTKTPINEEPIVTDVRIPGSAETVKNLQSISSEYKDLIQIIDNPAFKDIQDIWLAASEGLERYDKEFQKLTADYKAGTISQQEFIDGLTELEQKNLTNQDTLLTFREAVAKKTLEIEKKLYADIDKEVEESGKRRQATEVKTAEANIETWADYRDDIINQTLSLITDLTNLYDQFAENRIIQINKELKAKTDALDEEQRIVDDNLKKGRISEFEAERTSEQLRQKRLESERIAAEKERAIKKKQFQLDKAAALIQITINTAQGASKALAQGGIYGEVLAALVIAAGLAQAAIVESQPTPYRKGSKDTGAKGHMARVGEEGEEVVFMPSHSKVLPARQTKTYGEALDAMFDNRFDKYVMKNYTAPALERQSKQFEKERQKTFAENVSQSIFYNSTGASSHDLEQIRRRGNIITNADDIGRAVAKHLTTDPFRR